MKFMKITSLLFLTFLLMSCTPSKRVFFLKAEDILKPDSLNVEDYAEKYKEYDGVIINREYVYDHSGYEEANFLGLYQWDYTVLVKNKYIILNPDIEKLTTFKLEIPNGASIGNLYLKITSPDRTVTAYRINDLNYQENADGSGSYKFIYPNVKKGSIIEEAYEFTLKVDYKHLPPLDHTLRLQYDLPCEKLSFKYCYPSWWKTQVKKIKENADSLLSCKELTKEKKTILSYEAENIPAYKEELYSPSFKESAKYLELSVTELSMNDIVYKNPTNWRNSSSEFLDFMDTFDEKYVKDTLKPIIKGCLTYEDIFENIFNYVTGSFEIDSLSYWGNMRSLLEKRKGSELMLNRLLKIMLKKANIKADIVMIHSLEDGFLDEKYYSVSQFSIPGVKAVVSGITYILLPQYKYLPFGVLPSNIINQKMVVLSTGKIETVNGISLKSETHKEVFDLKINEGGIISVNEETHLSGKAGFLLRNRILKASPDQKNKIIKELITYNDGAINLVKYEFLKLHEYKEPLIIKAQYTIDNLVSLTPDEILFQTSGLFSPLYIENSKLEKGKRENPVRIDNNIIHTKNITITFPSSWRPVTELKDNSFENSFGELSNHFEVSGNQIICKQKQSILRCEQPKEKFEEFYNLIQGKAAVLSVPAIVFKRAGLNY